MRPSLRDPLFSQPAHNRLSSRLGVGLDMEVGGSQPLPQPARLRVDPHHLGIGEKIAEEPGAHLRMFPQVVFLLYQKGRDSRIFQAPATADRLRHRHRLTFGPSRWPRSTSRAASSTWRRCPRLKIRCASSFSSEESVANSINQPTRTEFLKLASSARPLLIAHVYLAVWPYSNGGTSQNRSERKSPMCEIDHIREIPRAVC